MANFISALVNNDTQVRVQGTTTATLSGSSNIYLTIPNWPVFATISRVIVQASAANYTGGSPTLYILPDGAKYRSVGASGSPEYYSYSLTASNQNQILSPGGIYIEDARRTSSLYILISTSSYFVTGTTFTITAEGTSEQSNNITDSDQSQFGLLNSNSLISLTNRSYRALNQNTNNGVTDLTAFATQNLKPHDYMAGPLATSYTFTALGSGNDYLYIGSVKQITSLYFAIRPSTALPSGLPLTSGGSSSSGSSGSSVSYTTLAQYWNGASWSTLSILDNTSDGQNPVSSGFSYSGEIAINTPSNWVLSQLSFDPYYVYIQQINNFQTQPAGVTYCPPRYWMRFAVPGLQNSSTLQLVAVKPLVY